MAKRTMRMNYHKEVLTGSRRNGKTTADPKKETFEMEITHTRKSFLEEVSC